MHLTDISPWGFIVTVLLLLAALSMVWLVDRKLLFKSMRIGLLRRIPRFPAKLWLAAAIAMLVVGSALTGCLLLSLSFRLFVPVIVAVLLCLLLSVPRAMQTYYRSLLHTQGHRRYLLANGGTHLESVIPSVRRSLRSALTSVLWTRSSPMVFGLLLFCCGMLIDGATLAATLVTTVVLWMAAVAGSVLSSVLAIWVADRWLFDQHERLTAASGKP